MKLSKTFDSFNKLKVLIIGDVMIDAYMWGDVTRISPEAPVPIIAVTRKENRLGGAANVALNIRAMGAKAFLCAVTGDDEKGELFTALLKEKKLPTEGILRIRNRVTTTKTRLLGSKHQMMRVDEEVETPLNEKDSAVLAKKIRSISEKENIDVIIFEDYDKGCITPSLISDITTFAKAKKIPVVVDPKKKNFMNYTNITLFKPNLKELKEGLKADFDHADEKELSAAVSKFIKKQNIDAALITLSERGIYIRDKAVSKLIPAHVREITDVSGAGDTVVSVAALCLAAGLDSSKMASIANLAGGLVCEKAGVVPVDKKQLLKEAELLRL